MIRHRWIVLPGVLTTAPLLGISLRADERRTIYESSAAFADDPLYPAREAITQIDDFLDVGNFRPIGRFFDYSEHALIFELSTFTGLPPQVVNSTVRLVMIAALIITVARLAAGVTGTASRGDAAHERMMGMAGIAMAISLVAGGFGNGLVVFSFLFIGSTIVAFWITMFAARDGDLVERAVPRGELITLAAIGATTAATYDLLYLTPPIAIAYLIARLAASDTGLGMAQLRSVAATRRVGALCVGFAVVFVPIRLLIADRCAGGDCYTASDVRVHTDAIEAFVTRAISAGPPAGWVYTNAYIEERDVTFGVADLLGNLAALAAIAGLAALAWRAFVRPSRDEGSVPPSNRALLALAGFGGAVIALGSLLASLATAIQLEGPTPGGGWRESMFTQSGAALIGTAFFLAVLDRIDARPALRVGAAVVVTLALTATLHANLRTSVFDRQDPTAATVNMIALATVSFADTPEANRYRCELIADYTDQARDEVSGGAVTAPFLDDLAMAEHGQPFCRE